MDSDIAASMLVAKHIEERGRESDTGLRRVKPPLPHAK
jgi:hypothetical protein